MGSDVMTISPTHADLEPAPEESWVRYCCVVLQRGEGLGLGRGGIDREGLCDPLFY